MGTSLVGLLPQNTYSGLIKFGDNAALSASLKALSDGAGNDTMLSISTTALQIGGATGLNWDNTNKRLGVGTNTPTGIVQIKTTQANTNGSIVFINNNASTIASITDTGSALTTLQFRGSNFGFVDGSGVLIGGGYGDTPTARLMVKGSGSTSATTSLLVQNSAGTAAVTVKDDLTTTFGATITGTNAVMTNNIEFKEILYGTNFFSQSTGATTLGAQAAANASAMLDIRSTTRGFLPPRMTTTQRNAIASPATGLQVFDSTMNAMCEYNGTAWRVLSAGAQSVAASTATTTVDMSSGNVQNITLTASTTLTLSSATVGTYIMKLIQGGSGSYTVTWPGTVIWSGGTAPTLTTTVGKVDIVTLVFDGTNFYGNYSLNY